VLVEITTMKRSSHWRRGCVAIFALWSVSAAERPAGEHCASRVRGRGGSSDHAHCQRHTSFTLHWAGDGPF